jgi:hypothetical protein
LEVEAHRSLSEQFQTQKLEWRQQYDGMNMQLLRLHNEVHAEMSQRDSHAEAETRTILALRHEVTFEVGQKNLCLKAENKERDELLSTEVNLSTQVNYITGELKAAERQRDTFCVLLEERDEVAKREYARIMGELVSARDAAAESRELAKDAHQRIATIQTSGLSEQRAFVKLQREFDDFRLESAMKQKCYIRDIESLRRSLEKSVDVPERIEAGINTDAELERAEPREKEKLSTFDSPKFHSPEVSPAKTGEFERPFPTGGITPSFLETLGRGTGESLPSLPMPSTVREVPFSDTPVAGPPLVFGPKFGPAANVGHAASGVSSVPGWYTGGASPVIPLSTGGVPFTFGAQQGVSTPTSAVPPPTVDPVTAALLEEARNEAKEWKEAYDDIMKGTSQYGWGHNEALPVRAEEHPTGQAFTDLLRDKDLTDREAIARADGRSHMTAPSDFGGGPGTYHSQGGE